MAQATLIAAGSTARLSNAISLAEGETIQISCTVPLVGDERVYLLHSADNGSTFQKTTGESNNYGVLLDFQENRNTVTGEGIFKIGITDTLATVAVVSG